MPKDNDPADRILRDVFGDKSPEPAKTPQADTRKKHYIKALREAKEIVEVVMGQSSDTIVKVGCSPRSRRSSSASPRSPWRSPGWSPRNAHT
ncbi:MAG: hypothetical protein M1343_06985 [Chloroflexi bacterium]|nr:hypothetical protein [Chloroflexota bacterium]MDA8186834.1 hypothetical protein [Dehalococcoidales bacterium]